MIFGKELSRKIYIWAKAKREMLSFLKIGATSLWKGSDYEYYFSQLRPILNCAISKEAAPEGVAKDLSVILLNLFHKRGLKSLISEEMWVKLFSDTISGSSDCTVEEMLHNEDIKPCFIRRKYLSSGIHTYNILLGLGHFRVAGQIRENIRKSLHLDGASCRNHRPDVGRHVGAAALEFGEYEAFISAFPFELLDFRKKEFLQAAGYRLSNQRATNCADKILAKECLEDKDFGQLIAGKNIALVGPADSGLEQGETIDSFDLVVRCNIISDIFGWNEIFKGRRCDISYLSGGHGAAMLKNSPKLPMDLKWLCFKDSRHWQKAQNFLKYTSDSHVRSRNFNTLNPMLFIGNANGIPNIAYDLLYFKPAHIKIFCADMMLTKSRDPGYHRYFDQEYLDDVSAFRYASSKSHDPGSNFWFMKSLSKDDRVSFDPRLDEVLSFNVEKYYDKLQSYYGPSWSAAIL